MRVLNFVFNKIDILRPNAIINYDLDNKPDNDVTMNHIDEDINKDIKELEENMIFYTLIKMKINLHYLLHISERK